VAVESATVCSCGWAYLPFQAYTSVGVCSTNVCPLCKLLLFYISTIKEGETGKEGREKKKEEKEEGREIENAQRCVRVYTVEELGRRK
jgi:hypothetical protein